MNTRPWVVLGKSIAGGRGDGPNLSGYEILSVLGRGAWANVYKAREFSTDTIVVLKTLHAMALQDPCAKQRFLREALVARGHRHPCVLGLLDVGECNGLPYLVMPYCARGDLEAERRRRGGRLSVVDAFRLMKPAMQGLAALHEQGFVHRDVKPQNILLDARGKSLIADFGLAKSIDGAGLSGITSSSTQGIGSLEFMAREQVTNFRFVHAATDVWAAAATFYFLLTSTYPRPHNPHVDFVTSILSTPAIPLRERAPSIAPRIAKIIDRALSDDVDVRPAHAGSFLGTLESVLG